MKKTIMVILLVTIVGLTAGCGGNASNQMQASDPGTVNLMDNKNENSNNESEDLSKEEDKSYISVYTGENVTKESFDNIPFLAVIENMKAARPQSGLSKADIVFETLAEGGIPRLMALFQSKKADKIGPIRSDRVYFNGISQSFKLPFAHCGGSQASIDEINSKGLMSLNEMYNGSYYWRDRTRKMPHNLYTSTDKITELITKKGYVKEPEFNIGFDNSYWENVKDKALVINMKLSGYYSTTYQYKNGTYYKTMNNVKVPDKSTGEQLNAKNIIVQITRISPIAGDEKKRVEIKLTGKGQGYIFSNGSYRIITWVKESVNSPIVLKDNNGQEVKLSKGNTWWEIIDGSSTISIK